MPQSDWKLSNVKDPRVVCDMQPVMNFDGAVKITPGREAQTLLPLTRAWSKIKNISLPILQMILYRLSGNYQLSTNMH